MFNVFLGLMGVLILLVSSGQAILAFRAASFRARGNRLIVRTRHPVMFWMNDGGLATLGAFGAGLLCWSFVAV
jgi:hypothetical protein